MRKMTSNRKIGYLIIFKLLLVLNVSAQIKQESSRFFCSDSLNNIIEDVRNDRYGKISSLLIYKGDYLVSETYFGFSQQSTFHPISSVTKSLTSIAVGVCIDQGLLSSIDIPIHPFFPEFAYIFEGEPWKKSITIRDLLAQTAGYEWDEWTVHYCYAGNPLVVLSQDSSSWLPIILQQPMDTIPGVKFCYNSPCSDLIKTIITRVAGMDFVEFVEENIFQKLDIHEYQWDLYKSNGHPAWGGLSLRTKDMAKIGLLMLNGGLWRGNQVVSKAWIDESTQTKVLAKKKGYGLHWWIDREEGRDNFYFAAGYGDQFVVVDEEKELVIAVNGKNFTDHKWEADCIDLVYRVLDAYNE